MKTKSLLFIMVLMFALSGKADDSCEKKVIGHHQAVARKLHNAAWNTFLNNFVGRKHMLAHTFAYPENNFVIGLFFGENYIADGMIEKVSKQSMGGKDIYETYIASLKSGELCEVLGSDYKKPRKIRKFLLGKLLAQ